MSQKHFRPMNSLMVVRETYYHVLPNTSVIIKKQTVISEKATHIAKLGNGVLQCH
jgi:hypothetical protein